MTDRDRIGRVGNAARAVAIEMERVLVKKMSAKQTVQIVGLIMGFWCAGEDKEHPRADGRSWRDIVKLELNQ